MFKKAIHQDALKVASLPYPLRMTGAGGYLVFKEAPQIVFSKVQSLRIGKAAKRFLSRIDNREAGGAEADRIVGDQGAKIKRIEVPPTLRIHCAKLAEDWPALGDDESYKIQINAAGVLLRTKTEWGVCAGLETLAQCAGPLAQGGWMAMESLIEDRPAYPWRGLCLDVCRHWIGINAIKGVLEGMAAAHLNVLHLHLSDDQAFRLNLHTLSGSNYSYDDKRYSGEDIKMLVSYAADRAIRIVPEIDIPGHCTALLAGHSVLGMNVHKPSTKFGGHTHSLDPVHEYTYVMLQLLFTEVAGLFPDRFVHTGCDEVNTESWRQNDHVQHFMKQMNFANFGDLLAHFNGRVHQLLKASGKSMVVWDDALHPRLPKDVIVQCWRSVAIREQALTAKHRVIFSSGYYLDLFLGAKTHYRFDPGAPQEALQAAEQAWLDSNDMSGLKNAVQLQLEKAGSLTAAVPSQSPNPSRVLGGEGCLWTELVDEHNLDSRLFSRLPAIAERLWLGDAVSTAHEEGLHDRLNRHLRHLEYHTALKPLSATKMRLAEAGLSPETIIACLALMRWLEPVKWYRRLLGDDAIRAMLGGGPATTTRPYNVTTPLNRIVDLCAPESLAKYELERRIEALAQALDQGRPTAETVDELTHIAGEWQQPLQVLKKSTSPLVTEVLQLSRRLYDCGDLLRHWTEAAVAGDVLPHTYRHYQEKLTFLAMPVAELNLAILWSLEALLGLCKTKEILEDTRPKHLRL